ncbi:YceI family protein [Solitalea koreensis]|uniref:Polyisoprenoid-binding protein YceI n=1 Tax=Solitalea koreensis TaxID=543615 RepID=A0A521CJH6_9SPHI|nr:YceI family protein [Solitalea koreensis]SMO59609.1 Polyisoprenoid-binding protein YceI [Solitalea koreensis]
MKKLIFSFIIAFAYINLGFIKPVLKGEETYKVVPSESNIVWFAKKVGGGHSGTIQLSEGYITMKGDKLAGGTFEFDMKSIAVSDIKDPNYKEKLIKDLKSDNFFGVEKFPTATFIITKTKKIDKSHFVVTGDLTIKGITKPVSFPVFVSVTDNGNALAVVSPKFKIERTQFGIKYNSATFFPNIADKAISDDFELEITQLVARK